MLNDLFDSCGLPIRGITSEMTPRHIQYFFDWIQLGFQGSMNYLQTRREQYRDIRHLFPDAKSVLMTAIPYQSFEISPGSVPEVRISNYALGRDYHRVARTRMKRLLSTLQSEYHPTLQYRIFVDTAPVLEKDFACMTGLGWVGKNTCFINPFFGSYVFLAGACLNLAIKLDPPPKSPSRTCGTCTRCLDICPTGALVDEYTLDARRCISYLTIEYRGEDDGGISSREGYLFGCDLCQQVCPYNQRAKRIADPDFKPLKKFYEISLERLTNMTAFQYDTWTRGSALRRMTYHQFKRNLYLLSPHA